jgi:patatin-related protein
MRQKELRIALVCYGGVSLAVYMHGVTKELWKLAQASRAYHQGVVRQTGSEEVYCRLLHRLESFANLRLRVMPDILSGASAGGINAVFLAQAIHSGQSLEPLTDLWLRTADVEELLDKDTSWISGIAKSWAAPIARLILKRPGNAVSESVAPETRREVRRKLSRFVRGRWFAPPFSGIGFSHLLADALDAMEQDPSGTPLLPRGHPLDLYVTATDFRGHVELLRLNSPQVVEETEHRMSIHFRSPVPAEAGRPLAHQAELVLASRATASFPGAFPPATVAELDRLVEERQLEWPGRDAFLQRVMPDHLREGDLAHVSLIDGSVLVNKPFDGAIAALRGRPAQREVDRRFVYIDPRPDRSGTYARDPTRPVGFFASLFGSLSTIPREQPIRDNLEELARQSREAARLHLMLEDVRPEIEASVERLFGHTLFLDRPTPRRLAAWRSKAQQAAAEQAGFAFHAYAQAKFTGIIDRLAETIYKAAPALKLPDPEPIAARLREYLGNNGLERLSSSSGGASPEAINFFRNFDVGFRVRRLRLLARRVTRDWEQIEEVTELDRDRTREALYSCLAPYFEREGTAGLGAEFAKLAKNVMGAPGPVLDWLANKRGLKALDEEVEVRLAEAFEAMPRPLRRRMLLAYLGFPYFDISSLSILPEEGLTEFDPVKVDRISPDDATSIRKGGTAACLRGVEFFNFGAFFSRAYRENDYLWGRLHGAERMIDLVTSTLDMAMEPDEIARFKREAFLVILGEEEGRLNADPTLVQTIRTEVAERMPSTD